MKLRYFENAVYVLLCATLGAGCSEQLSGGIVDEDGDFGLGPSAVKAEKDAQASDKEESDKNGSDKDDSDSDSDKDDSDSGSDKDASETGTSSDDSEEPSEATSSGSGEDSDSTTEASSTDSTDETVSRKLALSFATKGYNGRYGPSHVGAVWIEKKDGAFVRTIRQWGEYRQRHLVKWKAASGSDITDAVTGATLHDHQAHALTWDLRDADKKLVPNGEYVLCWEFTEENSSLGAEDGPSLRVPFTLGNSGSTRSPADTEGYVNVEVVVP